MKKIIALSLILAMIICASISLADVNLSDMTRDELIALRQQIDTMIGYSIQGRYTTGVDIKEGYYSLLTPDGYGTYVFVYPTIDDAQNEKNPLMTMLLEKNETTTIHLVDGYVLSISAGTCLLTPLETPSFAP